MSKIDLRNVGNLSFNLCANFKGNGDKFRAIARWIRLGGGGTGGGDCAADARVFADLCGPPIGKQLRAVLCFGVSLVHDVSQHLRESQFDDPLFCTTATAFACCRTEAPGQHDATS